jgi:hypothetical protein
MDHNHIDLLVVAQLKTKDVAMIYKHIEQVSAHALFSNCEKYRYRLDILLNEPTDSDTKIVCAVMQNPSVANSEIADKSVQFLEKLIFTKGNANFSGVHKLIVVNQFAFVQTNDFSGQDEHIGPDNDLHIRQAISESDIILVAWGSSNAYDARKAEVNAMLKPTKGKTLLLGKSHPSRVSYVDYVSAYNI